MQSERVSVGLTPMDQTQHKRFNEAETVEGWLVSRKLHDKVDFSAKWVRLQNVRGLELPCERRHSPRSLTHSLTHGLHIGPESSHGTVRFHK